MLIWKDYFINSRGFGDKAFLELLSHISKRKLQGYLIEKPGNLAFIYLNFAPATAFAA